MAMYQLGDIRLLARLARPRIGVVTAVLPVHLERLGTIERIHQAKQELIEELPSNGVAVLNADDPRVAQMATATEARVVRYGVSATATTPAPSPCSPRSTCCASCPGAARSPSWATCSSWAAKRSPATAASATARRRCSTC